MARPASKDPLDRFRWGVQIDGFTKLGFTSCDVPSFQVQTKSYAEGGQHLAPLQIIDGVTYKPVTLTRGVTIDGSFEGWAKQFIELVNGKTENLITKAAVPFSANTSIPAELLNLGATNFSSPAQSANFPLDYRRTVKITHMNRAGKAVKIYTLFNAFPIEYEPASSFASDGDDLLSMEKLTLGYESFTVEVINDANSSNPFDIRDISKRLINRSF
jgi:phage tail-like protein